MGLTCNDTPLPERIKSNTRYWFAIWSSRKIDYQLNTN
ncbi:hypothetical protein L915_09143 [Phytophthora nicotianae]|uniref:Uncharacterized protein n=1 Tax=Phytophthora nicotianae TaxID=4792 RepID=W2GTL2_PHYNI|nr:hypothetical protein L915_09143 [Phytophthora nicotianae]